MGHYLTEEFGDNKLGLPYWDWTSSTTLPDLWDGLKFPNFLDRMNRYPDAPGFLGERLRSGSRFLPNEVTIDGWRVEWTSDNGKSTTASQFIGKTDDKFPENNFSA